MAQSRMSTYTTPSREFGQGHSLKIIRQRDNRVVLNGRADNFTYSLQAHNMESRGKDVYYTCLFLWTLSLLL